MVTTLPSIAGFLFFVFLVLINVPLQTGCCQAGVQYYRLVELHPTQLRYAIQNVEEKVARIQLEEGARRVGARLKWEMLHDNGRSAYPPGQAIPLIKGPFGYVIADGHHKVLASFEIGASTIPARQILDLSWLDEKSFWRHLEQEGYAYLIDLDGERRHPPRRFHDLKDDPNRYFAAIIARKYPESKNLSKGRGAEYPVWIKIGRDIPFIEFRIADALSAAGIQYKPEMGDEPPLEMVERARLVLRAAEIPGLRLVPERRHYSEIPL